MKKRTCDFCHHEENKEVQSVGRIIHTDKSGHLKVNVWVCNDHKVDAEKMDYGSAFSFIHETDVLLNRN